jgi:hypothetical protein
MKEPLGRAGHIAAILIAACFAAGTAQALLRTPVQVSDALETILRASRSPTPIGAFTRSFTYSSQMLRPMGYAATNAVLHVATAAGTSSRTAFRAVHAALACALFALFTFVAWPRSRIDLVLFPLVLTMLVGMHSFAGMMREAYPINHFLEVAVYALIVLAAARSRGRWIADVVAIVSIALALLTLEAGVLTWVVAVTAWMAGWRGISRRALVAATLMIGAYAVWRIGYLHIHAGGVGDHSTGFGNTMLSVDEQIARFGIHPLRFFSYNALSAMASVLFSEPRDGVWALVGIHRTPAGVALPPPSIFIEIASSAGATAVILWAIARWRRGKLDDPQTFVPLLTVAAAVVLASGAISYAYNKDEIISTAGVFYVLAVGAALREATLTLTRTEGTRRAIATCAIAALSIVWAWRAVGFEYKMLRSASKARSEWAWVLPPGGAGKPPLEPIDRGIATSLKTEAMFPTVVDYRLLPHWMERYWGE